FIATRAPHSFPTRRSSDLVYLVAQMVFVFIMMLQLQSPILLRNTVYESFVWIQMRIMAMEHNGVFIRTIKRSFILSMKLVNFYFLDQVIIQSVVMSKALAIQLIFRLNLILRMIHILKY